MSKIKIAIQGELGAYSHIAAERLYKDTDIKTCSTFEETFKQAYIDIFSDNLERQKEWFETMYLLVYSTEWISAKAMDKWKLSITQAINKKLVLLKQRYLETKDQIEVSKENWDNMKAEELEVTLESINKQGEEVSNGEIFIAWELDNPDDNLPENSENS